MPAVRTEAPTYAAGWVAQRLGVSTATLRTWHRRYGIGPTARTAGGHRRYSGTDLGRLENMHRLVAAGVPVAEAATLSHPDRASRRPVPTRPRDAGGRSGDGVPGAVRDARRLLERAAVALDAAAADRVLADALRVHGVAGTWTAIAAPVLRRLGERYAQDESCIAAEHVLTDRVRAALVTVVARRARSVAGPRILLAAVEHEQHVLPLHALAAALTEHRRSTIVLGAVPLRALTASLAAVRPAAVFVWAHVQAGRPDLLPLDAVDGAGRIVVGGAGWTGDVIAGTTTDAVRRVDSLPAAVHALIDQQ